MSTTTVNIGMYKVLRRVGVPREMVAFDANFDNDYFFTEVEKQIICNLIEFNFKVELPQSVEKNADSIDYFINYFRKSHLVD